MESSGDAGRYAVRFSGEMTTEATAALRAGHMGLQRTDSFFGEPVPYSTTVVLRASDEGDAVSRVRGALEGHGDFTGFEAAAFDAYREDDD
jgi:hypothetical protein